MKPQFVLHCFPVPILVVLAVGIGFAEEPGEAGPSEFGGYRQERARRNVDLDWNGIRQASYPEKELGTPDL